MSLITNKIDHYTEEKNKTPNITTVTDILTR